MEIVVPQSVGVSWSSSSYSIKSTAEGEPDVGRRTACGKIFGRRWKTKAEDVRGVPLQQEFYHFRN